MRFKGQDELGREMVAEMSGWGRIAGEVASEGRSRALLLQQFLAFGLGYQRFTGESKQVVSLCVANLCLCTVFDSMTFLQCVWNHGEVVCLLCLEVKGLLLKFHAGGHVGSHCHHIIATAKKGPPVEIGVGHYCCGGDPANR